MDYTNSGKSWGSMTIGFDGSKTTSEGYLLVGWWGTLHNRLVTVRTAGLDLDIRGNRVIKISI